MMYLGEALFPAEKTYKTEINWFKGYKQQVAVLQLSALDTKPNLRDRIGVKELSEKIPFFRESMRLDETTRRDLQDALKRNEDNPEYQAQVLQPTFDDVGNLVSGGFAVLEKMRMAALFFGKIEFKVASDTGRKAHKEINYDPSGEWTDNNNTVLTGTSAWTVANKATSTPIQDIQAQVKQARMNGKTVVTLLMNSNTYDGMVASESIPKAINPIGSANAIYTEDQLVTFVESMAKVKIVIYDKHYLDENQNQKLFVPDGYTALLPAGTLGKTKIGLTPEEYDLLGAKTEVATGKDAPNGNVACTVVRNGLGPTIVTEKTAVPINIITTVSLTGLPTFEMMDSVYVMNVWGD